MAKATDKKVTKKEEKVVDKKVAAKKEEEKKKVSKKEEAKKKKEESSSEEESSEEESSEEEEEKKEESSSEEESSEEEKKEESSSEEESSEEEEEEEKVGQKRKQSGDDDEEEHTSKKQAVGSSKCFIGSLSFNTDDDSLKKAFSKYGKVTFAKVSMNDQGRSKGFGFVEFDKEESAQKALEMNGADLDGRTIKVEISQGSRDTSNKFGGSQSGGSGQATKVLFVGNLSFQTDKDSLFAAFEGFEGVQDARIATDKETGRPRGFGYLEFSDADSAKAAFEQMNGADVDGRNIRLDYAAERTGDAGGRGGDRGGFRGGRGGFRGGDRGGFRGGRGGGDRGGFRGGRGGGDRGGRGGFRGGRGGDRGGFRGGRGGFEGKKMTFDD